MPQIRVSVRVVLFVVLCISLSGCGGEKRLPITGSVTVDGTPLAKGYVIFIPDSGTPGPTAGADIVDGVYEVDASKGVFEGKFKVEINGWRDSDKTYEDSVTGEEFAEPEQFLPAKFNKETELIAELNAKDPVADFDLKLE
jgi:hypothetical protein